MTESLNITRNVNGDDAEFFFVGMMDEESQYDELQFDGIKTVVFNFEKVTGINSLGIQKWILFMKSISTEVSIVFDRCSVPIVNQMSIFPEFFGGRSVEINSFYAPYYCEKCDDSTDVLLDIQKYFPDRAIKDPPQVSCEECDGKLVFDEVKRSYLRFLSKRSF